MDIGRVTILFFAVCGLDILDAIDTISGIRDDIISWLYVQQVLPTNSQGRRISTEYGIM